MSLRLSPLETLEPLAEKLMTSADSRLAAASNEIRVRVESSKNRLTTVRPRRVGSFLISRCWVAAIGLGGVEHVHGLVAGQVGGGEQVPHHATPAASAIGAAVDSDSTTSSAPSYSVRRTLTRSASEVGQVLADVVGADRQLAVAAVDQHGELHGAGPAEVAERVEGGADRAAGEEHVVDEDDDLAVDARVGDVGALEGADRVAAQVVAVHRDVERAVRDLGALDAGDPLGQPAGQRDAAGRDAEQDEVRGALVVLQDLVRDAGQRPLDVWCFEHRSGTVHGPDLLPRLTGRVVKGRHWNLLAQTVPRSRPRLASGRPEPRIPPIEPT